MPDVISLGELLIDFVATAEDVSLRDAPGFVKAPGGAPANVACGVAKLGVSAGFIGKVGDDAFGKFLAGVLEASNVNVSHLAFAEEVRTTLAFVGVRSDGAKDIMFYRNPGADMMLCPEDISVDYVRTAKILHFGSISMIDETPKAATLTALRIAQENGLLRSYDPNLRLALWGSPDQAKREIWLGFEHADLAKVSEEEWEFITDTTDFDEGSKKILDRGPKVVIISRGEAGCYYNNGQMSASLPGFEVAVAETIGAGDGFVASVLVSLLDRIEHVGELGSISDREWKDILTRANGAGALTCTKVGAIPALPSAEELDAFLAERTGGP